MDLSASFSSISNKIPPRHQLSLHPNSLQLFRSHFFHRRHFIRIPPPPFSRQNNLPRLHIRVSNQPQIDGFVLEDVPHLTNFLHDLPVRFRFEYVFSIMIVIIPTQCIVIKMMYLLGRSIYRSTKKQNLINYIVNCLILIGLASSYIDAIIFNFQFTLYFLCSRRDLRYFRCIFF